MVQYSENITRDYDFPRFWESQCTCTLLPLQCVPGSIFLACLSSVCRVAFVKNTVLGMRLENHLSLPRYNLINTYRKAFKLFMDNQAILSSEGTTQGDPLAMPFYALAMLPLIDTLMQSCNVRQVWYADDVLAAEKLTTLNCWWDELCSLGPAFGYFANASKTWLVTKRSFLLMRNLCFRAQR